MNDLTRATKIVGTCVLMGIGTFSFAGGRLAPEPDAAGVLSIGCFCLGMWLLVGAWTARSIPAQINGGVTWFFGNEPNIAPETPPTATAPDPTPKNPA